MMGSSISVEEGARWLAKMAARDGVVSPREESLLRKYAYTYGLDAAYITGLANSIAEQAAEPEVVYITPSEYRGRKFEDFIVSLCSDASRFTLLSWRSDKISGSTFPLDNLLPDLHLQHKLEEKEVEYLIECKYRSSWGENGIDLSSQIKRYKDAAKDKKVELFIAIGIGGSSSNPEELFMVPGRMIKKDNVIDKFRYSKCRCEMTPEGFHKYINHYFNKRVFKIRTK